MHALEGIRVFPSEANFILFRTLNKTAEAVFSDLLEHKVLIKNVANADLLENCLRVTVGTEKENRTFIDVLQSALA